MALSRRHLRFFLVDEVLGSVIVNFALNGAIAFCAFRNQTHVPLWGWASIAADTMATAFFLPLFTAFFTNLLVRAQVGRQLLPPLPAASFRASTLSERSWLQRGTLLGLAAMGIVGVSVVAGFALLGPAQLSPSGFIWFKATFAAALGALVTPLLGWWSLQDASRAASGSV